MIEEMAEHAALLAARFGDRVDDWGTLNEPFNYLLAAYGVGVFPPGKAALLGDLLGEFVPVLRDYLLAHAAAYRAIEEADAVDADRDGSAADVGLSLSVGEWVPARSHRVSDDPEDVAARDRMAYVYNHLVVDTVLSGRLDVDLDGAPDVELPGLQGALDWLGVQYYFHAGVTGDGGLVPVLNLTPCVNGLDFGACVPPVDKTFCVPAMRYEHHAPGLYGALRDLGARYPGLPLVVTESGIATRVGERRAEVMCGPSSRSSARAARASTCGATTTGASTTTSSGPRGSRRGSRSTPWITGLTSARRPRARRSWARSRGGARSRGRCGRRTAARGR
ncbi:family 1 glycosylhydrolase [Sorangium sp. So ce394]